MLKIDKGFINTFLKIAIPMSLQQLMLASLSMLDTIMVGQLGDAAIAAVGIGNQVYFLVYLLLLGISGGCSLFASQFYGKGDYRSIKSVIGLGLLIGVLLISMYSVFTILFPIEVIGIFTSDNMVIEYGADYLRIISFSFVIVTITTVYSTVVRSTGNALLPMVISFFGIGLNTFLNYIMIFGKFGLSPMGVRGAAYATLISRIVEMLLLIVLIYTRNRLIAGNIKEMFTLPRKLINSFLTQSGLMIVKDLVWGLGITLYLVIYGRLGTMALAATNIQQTVGNMMYVFIHGIAQACLILVGQKLGEGQRDTANEYAMFFTRITIYVAIVVSAVMLLIRPIILMPFNVSQSVRLLANDMLLVKGLIFTIVCYNTVAVIGIMRSGGDTKFSLVMDIFAVWGIGLILAVVTGLVLKLSAAWVLATISSQEIFKYFCLRKRVASKKWMNNLVNEL